jgi:glycosyltransferase involved in cell wall biosynthesis
MSRPLELSICFCAWNEQDNITKCVEDALKNLPALVSNIGHAEIIVVDNASTDRTPDIVTALSQRHPQVRLIRHPRNMLYSGSHRTAFRESNGKVVAIIDGDFQHTAQDLAKGLELMRAQGCDVIFGWKKDRKDGLMRLVFSTGLMLISRALIGHRLHDINCGFRLFSARAAQQIQIQETINSVGPEIYCECRRLGFKVGELAVTHFPRVMGEGIQSTVVPLVRNSFRFVKYLWRLRQRYGASPVLAQETLCK